MAISGDGTRIQDKAPDTPRNRGNYDAPHLTPVTPAEDIRSIALNRISGTAVLVGAAMALVVQIIMNLFGASFGLSYSGNDAGAGANVTAEDVALGGLLWWSFAGIIAAFIGGLTAGRASGEPKARTAGWNGLGSWAVSVLVVAVLVSITGSVLAAQNNNQNSNSIFYGQYMVPRGVNLGMNTAPAGGNTGSAVTVTGQTQGSAVTGATGSRTGADQTTGNASVDAQTASRIALISAIALVLGALAAWFGGCAGAVDPTITDPDLRRTSSYH